MKPTSIPDTLNIQGFEKVFVGPPSDDPAGLDVQGVEAMHYPQNGDDPPMYAVLIQLSQDDIQRIILEDGLFWLVQVTDSMVPFAFQHVIEFPYVDPHFVRRD